MVRHVGRPFFFPKGGVMPYVSVRLVDHLVDKWGPNVDLQPRYFSRRCKRASNIRGHCVERVYMCVKDNTVK